MLKLDKSFTPTPPKPTGRESLVERWFLHKLNAAATEVNRQLTERNFMLATSAAYNLWLYELCDVYIVCNLALLPYAVCLDALSRPTSLGSHEAMADESAPEATKRSAQHTLYTCLDFRLRILHPFMPFVTEELWQRLPRRETDPPSLMLTSHPIFDKNMVFEQAESVFDCVFATIRASRSLAASYSLQTDVQLFFHAQSDAEATVFDSQISTIIALTKGCKSAKVVRDIEDVPAGCGSAVLSDTLAVHILVRGLVDLDSEIAKCDKKLGLALLNAEMLRKIEAQPDYENTIPEAVRAGNSEKLRTFEAEITTLEQSKTMFQRLK